MTNGIINENVMDFWPCFNDLVLRLIIIPWWFLITHSCHDSSIAATKVQDHLMLLLKPKANTLHICWSLSVIVNFKALHYCGYGQHGICCICQRNVEIPTRRGGKLCFNFVANLCGYMHAKIIDNIVQSAVWQSYWEN